VAWVVTSRSVARLPSFGVVHRSAKLVVLALAAAPVGGTDVAQPAGIGQHRCTGAETWTLVRTFVESFNGGRLVTLDRLFARGADFEWYSVTGTPGERLRGDARNRSTLVPYFAERHVHGEQLKLTWFSIRTSRRDRQSATWVNFQFRLIRSADDLSPTRYVGNGAAFCPFTPHTLAVWSMGAEAEYSLAEPAAVLTADLTDVSEAKPIIGPALGEGPTHVLNG
jgi:hypothetical protein